MIASMLPDIDTRTGYLPPGVHHASWAEVVARFGQGEVRARLAAGLLAALRALAAAGCRSVLLDGSFVSSKAEPGDYDAAWEPEGVRLAFLDPVLLGLPGQRAAMKAKHLGELFSADMMATPEVSYREFFLTDRQARPKGVVSIDLRTLP